MSTLQPNKCPSCGSDPIFQRMDTNWYLGYCSVYACNFPYNVSGVTEQAAIAKWNEVTSDWKEQRSWIQKK